MKNIFVLSYKNQRIKPISLVINYVIVFFIISLLFYISFTSFNFNFQWAAPLQYKNILVRGYINTIIIALFSLILSIILGLLIGIGQSSHIIPFRIFSKLYVMLIRGTPLLVQILIFYYVIANAAGLDNRYISGILILSIFSSAYVAEIFRANLESVNRTQLETALSIGLTKTQTFRYVILPQLIKQTLPPLAGQLVSLIKDSSLLSIISIREFTMTAQEINAVTYSTLEIYIPLAIGYLILTLPVSLFTRYLEKKYKYET